MEYLLIVVFAVYVLYRIYVFIVGSGDVIYEDDSGGRKRTFVNLEYGLSARPDRIEKTRDGGILTEYKPRRGPVYQSDINQVYAGALAARGAGIVVTKGRVETGRAERVFSLPDDEGMLSKIRKPLEQARIVKQGGVPEAYPNKNKCTGCSYEAVCEHSQA